MLTLHKQLPSATTEHERKMLQRQITATDEEIDQLVYALYGLTAEEIAIVEGAGWPVRAILGPPISRLASGAQEPIRRLAFPGGGTEG